jgi:hypothetical protein
MRGSMMKQVKGPKGFYKWQEHSWSIGGLLLDFTMVELSGFKGKDNGEHSEHQDEHDPDDLFRQDGWL